MYNSLVRPHLEYASSVWNPYLHKDIKNLKEVEKFALKIISRQWNLGYQDLLEITKIPSLEARRARSSLCMLFKIVHGLCFCPADFVISKQNYSGRTNRHLLLHQPFARTKAYQYSFVPRTVNQWNLLPEPVVLSSLSSFKTSIMWILLFFTLLIFYSAPYSILYFVFILFYFIIITISTLVFMGAHTH